MQWSQPHIHLGLSHPRRAREGHVQYALCIPESQRQAV